MDAIVNAMPELFPALIQFDQGLLPWFFGGNLLMGILAYLVGERQGNGCLGCFLGIILGPFGLIITALMGRNRG